MVAVVTVVSLGKALISTASIHPDVQMGTCEVICIYSVASDCGSTYGKLHREHVNAAYFSVLGMIETKEHMHMSKKLSRTGVMFHCKAH